MAALEGASAAEERVEPKLHEETLDEADRQAEKLRSERERLERLEQAHAAKIEQLQVMLSLPAPTLLPLPLALAQIAVLI